MERNKEKLAEVDAQIAALHNQNPRTFVAAVVLELLCRLFSTLEIFFILLVIQPDVTIPQCILISAIASFVIYKHRSNIVRLVKGEESKIFLFKKRAEPAKEG